jgi:hypothetical protein
MVSMAMSPEQLPYTASHYQWKGKPAALIAGRCGVIYDPGPRTIPWTVLQRQGKPISVEQFRILLSSLE